jgi:hypothetical protein
LEWPWGLYNFGPWWCREGGGMPCLIMKFIPKSENNWPSAESWQQLAKIYGESVSATLRLSQQNSPLYNYRTSIVIFTICTVTISYVKPKSPREHGSIFRFLHNTMTTPARLSFLSRISCPQQFSNIISLVYTLWSRYITNHTSFMSNGDQAIFIFLFSVLINFPPHDHIYDHRAKRIHSTEYPLIIQQSINSISITEQVTIVLQSM